MLELTVQASKPLCTVNLKCAACAPSSGTLKKLPQEAQRPTCLLKSGEKFAEELGES